MQEQEQTSSKSHEWDELKSLPDGHFKLSFSYHSSETIVSVSAWMPTFIFWPVSWPRKM